MADDLLQETTFGTYYVRPGCQDEFERTIPESWRVLRRLGFITEAEPVLFRSVAQPRTYIEMAHWLPQVMGPAHEHPDVIPVWTRLANTVESRTPEAVPRGLTFSEFVRVTVTP
ncbi:hypothetical protein [Quadrisphaera granulorum]|nr:hypothetical protein [Quadrisphaera granulorum]